MSFIESLSGTTLLVSFMTIFMTTFLVLKRNKNQRDITKPKYDLPPIGPAFAEFYPNMMKAQNQSQAIHDHGTIFTIPSPLKGIVPTQVVICEPHLVKDLCVKQANMYRPPSHFTTRSDAFAHATRQVVGTGVTGLKGEEWMWRKTALLKEFHKNKLLDMERGLVEIVYHEGMALCEELEKAADSKSMIQADHLTTQAAVGVVFFFFIFRKNEI
jgi:cytochrome P450